MYIRLNYKSPLHFYTGAEGGGRLTQADYPALLEEIVAPNRDKDWILLDDNNNADSTRGKADNKVKQAKTPSEDLMGSQLRRIAWFKPKREHLEAVETEINESRPHHLSRWATASY